MNKELAKVLNLLKKKKLIEAENLCSDLSKKVNDNYEIFNTYAVILFQLKKYDQAINNWKKSITLNTKYYFGFNNLGNAYLVKEQFQEALKYYDRAIELKADYFEAYYNRGNAYLKLDFIDKALENYDYVLKIKGNYIPAIKSKAYLLTKIKKFKEAILEWDKLLSYDFESKKAYIQKADIYFDLNQLDEAIKNYKNALSLDSKESFLLGTMIHAKTKICDWENLDNELKDIEKKIKDKKKVSTPYPVTTFFDSPYLQLEASKIMNKEYILKYTLDNNFSKKKFKKIKIGYYSADFRTHAMGHLMVRMLELHDKSNFEIYGFYFGPKINEKDQLQSRIMKCFDKFININSMSDLQVSQLSRKLNINIAVDLMGFTGNPNRFGAFIYRSAPIQVNFLGYPGTSGSDCIDYLVADKTLVPEKSQKFYSEKIIYLPDTYQPNEENKKISEKLITREKLGLPINNFVFCCFNSHQKINPVVFYTWMDILKKNTDSVLWLLKDNKFSKKNLKNYAAEEGVDPSRLIFAERVPHDEHLQRLKFVDLILDTYPYNAHTTCSDALRIGVPVLTRIGESFASRVAASLLNTLNMPELITKSHDDYKKLALYISNNSDYLKKLKNKIKENKINSNLFKTKIFTKNLEKSYTKIYDNYIKGLSKKNIEL